MGDHKTLLEYGYKAPRLTGEFTDCSMPVTFDQYKKCSFGCLYCFAAYNRSNNPQAKDYFTNKVKAVNPEQVKRKIQEGMYWEYFFKNKKVLQWGSMADPFCNFERKYGVGLEILQWLINTQIPIRFSTKASVIDNEPLMQLLEDNISKIRDRFAFMYSIVSYDKEVAAIVEPGTPTPQVRFENLKELKRKGFYTILRLRPFIPAVTNKTLDDLLGAAEDAKVDAISVEFFCLEMRMNDFLRKRYRALSTMAGFDMLKYYRKHSNMGGYLRLNPEVKAPTIEKLLEFSKRTGIHLAISDPHFKELNHSGSCCGLPKEETGVPLSNWWRAQWTNLLVKARQRYWKDNISEIRWDDYLALQETDLYRKVKAGEPVLLHGKFYHRYKNVSLLDHINILWNTPNRFTSPYGYFHKVMTPIGLDKNKNVVYRYVPRPQEIHWKEVGLL